MRGGRPADPGPWRHMPRSELNLAVRTNEQLRRRVLVVMAVLVLALLWHQVFVMTGVLWWNAPAQATPVTRPHAPRLRAPASGWVDVDTYLRTHPVWVP